MSFDRPGKTCVFYWLVLRKQLKLTTLSVLSDDYIDDDAHASKYSWFRPTKKNKVAVGDDLILLGIANLVKNGVIDPGVDDAKKVLKEAHERNAQAVNDAFERDFALKYWPKFLFHYAMKKSHYLSLIRQNKKVREALMDKDLKTDISASDLEDIVLYHEVEEIDPTRNPYEMVSWFKGDAPTGITKKSQNASI